MLMGQGAQQHVSRNVYTSVLIKPVVYAACRLAPVLHLLKCNQNTFLCFQSILLCICTENSPEKSTKAEYFVRK